jgi:hypothetical protein
LAEVNFSEYSKRLYPNMSGLHNQSHFVGSLFNAAGSTFFPIQGTYGTDDNQRKLYSGQRVFNRKMKASFPSPVDFQRLAIFFDTRIGDTSLPSIMSAFGIPIDEARNKSIFISALCTQFQNIVSESTDNVDDVVAEEYRRLLQDDGFNVAAKQPLYPNDDYQLISETPDNRHIVSFYEEFEHKWTIKNSGTVVWDGRCLECINQGTTRIRALNTVISIPKVTPGNEAGIIVRLDARGFEGSFESIWVMKDNDGKDCFPDMSKALKIAVTVENRSGEPVEVI